MKKFGNLKLGDELTLVCTHNTSNFDWWRDDQVMTKAVSINNTKALKFEKLSVIDINNYTCKPSTTSNASRSFEVVFNGRLNGLKAVLALPDKNYFYFHTRFSSCHS